MKTNLILFLCCLLLSSCYQVENSNITITATVTPNSSGVVQPTVKVTNQLTETPIITPTELILKINENCVKPNQSSPTGLNGTLVFQKDFGGPLYFSKLETGSQKTVPDNPGDEVYGAYISPNGRWIIYQSYPQNSNGDFKFILAGPDGTQEREMPLGDWNVSSIFWLNDNALRVAEPDNALSYIKNFALDPFTGTKTPLLSDFPGLAGKGSFGWGVDDNASELGITKGLNLIYDPTLTKVVYPRVDGYVSLFDIENNQEIARLSAPGRGRLPKWSLDGKEVAIIGTESNSNGDTSDSFLVASNNGSYVKRIVMPSSIGKNVHIEDYSWSPNGKRIALWLKTDGNRFTSLENPFELAVIDLENNEMTNYCISGTSTIEQEGNIHKANIIWSPDNTKLLITQYNNENKNSTTEIIVDSVGNIAFNVAENMRPIGWMVNQP